MRHWLIKSEPDVFGIDDLARVGREPWNGIRNYQARNFMRDDMEVGDLALFYHSNAKPPGVVGIARVVSEPYADDLQFDPQSDYFDAKSTAEAPRWLMRDFEFVLKFPEMVTLDQLKGEPALEGMRVLQRGTRLSITPVEPDHFDQVCSMAGVKV
ncbi:putative RNA-binding protein with PUA-like domain [Haloferula luteola]|uniref:Putative RNA-binding protein with PUA-like domain n=1 Tax=Haloferula luteola TaxID=595692 RepID=A0A840VBY4_9BACT|nr:EVE domain-containing protein [Haloferula luteola]MBB5351319.1 putative RNA-binding protein with PUA-like domain [Haloferula luteola]